MLYLSGMNAWQSGRAKTEDNPMAQENLEASLKEIRYLLSHLHGEITALEDDCSQVLLILNRFEGACNIEDLTGAMRTKALFRKWEALLEECRRLEKQSGVTLIDNDQFRPKGDTPVDPTGDEVQRRMSSLLKQYVAVVAEVEGEYGIHSQAG
jgi:GGDEF domain-containing protein